MRDILDPKKTGKVKGIIQRFLDEYLLKRIGAYIRHQKQPGAVDTKHTPTTIVPPTATTSTANARKWPESEKDRLIRLKMEERRKLAEEEHRRQEELRRQEAELQQMNKEDVPAMDAEQLEEWRAKRLLEEERLRLEAKEGEEEEEEPEEDEDQEEGEDQQNLNDRGDNDDQDEENGDDDDY